MKVIKNLGVYFTLNNGFESFTEITNAERVGLESRFLDIHDIVDVSLFGINNNQNFDNAYVEDWTIKELPKEDIIELDI